MKKTIHFWWTKLVHSTNTQKLNRLQQKREIVFNKLMLLGILFLVVNSVCMFFMSSYIVHLFPAFSKNTIPYWSLTLIYILIFIGIYYINSKKPTIYIKFFAHFLLHIYILLLCMFLGENSHIEITIFALMNLPYFVVEEEKKKIFILSTFIGIFFLAVISIGYSYQKPLFPIPEIFHIYSFYLAALFNILIISLCSYQFYIETIRTEKSLEFEQEKTDSLL